ncbi:MAG: hypothetical protein HRU36_05430 [Rickettsiales bacterium]|nr:hypothetical protein [Rickettsiales bacterium]
MDSNHKYKHTLCAFVIYSGWQLTYTYFLKGLETWEKVIKILGKRTKDLVGLVNHPVVKFFKPLVKTLPDITIDIYDYYYYNKTIDNRNFFKYSVKTVLNYFYGRNDYPHDVVKKVEEGKLSGNQVTELAILFGDEVAYGVVAEHAIEEYNNNYAELVDKCINWPLSLRGICTASSRKTQTWESTRKFFNSWVTRRFMGRYIPTTSDKTSNIKLSISNIENDSYWLGTVVEEITGNNVTLEQASILDAEDSRWGEISGIAFDDKGNLITISDRGAFSILFSDSSKQLGFDFANVQIGKAKKESPNNVPDFEELEVYNGDCFVSNEKTKKILRYEECDFESDPAIAVSFDANMFTSN